MTETLDPDLLWSRLLSGEPQLIRAAWDTLSAEEREAARRHLHSMTEEPGWQPGQRSAARAALECLETDRGE